MTERGFTPSSRVQPPMMITNARAAVTSIRNTTSGRALLASGFCLFGRQSSYPGRMAPASIARQVYGLGCALAGPNHSPAVRAEGLEPPRSFEHQDLNLDRLPVPARPRGSSILDSGPWELRMCVCADLGRIVAHHPDSSAFAAADFKEANARSRDRRTGRMPGRAGTDLGLPGR